MRRLAFDTKPSNTNDGDLYYDKYTRINSIYSKGGWFELKVSLSKNLERKEKIKAILK